ncbi:MAG TPA: hypothetical protein P5572_11200 [Phycisphaerae bacterium]|nr:hypothetical protein [Phycisphaerales bacterium]HRX85574.1 hypothetical protein [Phycisphaerae bacterium]
MSAHLPANLSRLQRPALIAGLVALAVCVVGVLINPAQFFIAYLFAFLFWLGISLGAMAFSMVHWMVHGRWGLLIRRFQEAAAGVIPLMILFFIPVALAVHVLYPWANEARLAGDALLRHKAPYLNLPFWLVRAAVYFCVWTVIALLLRRWSLRAEASDAPKDRLRVQRLCAVGILAYVFTMSYAAVDWNMSREPHYYSTVFGFIVVVGHALEGLAFVVLVLTLVAKEAPYDRAIAPQALNDLGSLLFTLVILFGYMEFAQYLVNWAGNQQNEIAWYVPRMAHAWGWLAVVLVVFHFFVPFFTLLSRRNKRSLRVMGGVAVLLLVMRLVDVFWMVAPSGTAAQPHVVGAVAVIFAFVAPIGIGGVWVAAFLWLLGRRPLLPAAALAVESAEGAKHAA